MRLAALRIRDRVRLHLGDQGEFFRFSAHGDHTTTRFDLPVQNVSPERLHVFTITGQTASALPYWAYTLDSRNGVIFLKAPLPTGTMLVAEGWHHGLFADEELDYFIEESSRLHTLNRSVVKRVRDANGFIRYVETPMTLDALPELEHQLLVYLATIEALWALSVDASTDIDVSTADGTMLPRSQRFQQLRQEIDLLTDKYKEQAALLNVGLYAIEQLTLRRVSYTTGRLVPVFKAREYDATGRPIRMLPTIDGRDVDDSGIPSPYWPGTWGF